MNKPVCFLTAQAEGDDVSRLHGGLLELGWNIAPDELTGAFFGTTTRLAVAEFQRERNLAVGGAGQITQRALGALQARDAINAFQWWKTLLSVECLAS